jgi:hypothetical protein
MTKFIKFLAWALMAPAVSASGLHAQANPEPAKFAIDISADKPEVPLGANVTIAITVTNISEEGISIGCGYHGKVQEGYQYDIRDEHGTAVPKVLNQDPSRPNRPPGNSRPGGCGIKAGAFMKVYSTMSDDYAFDRPGAYNIQVWKPATKGSPDKPELNKIFSNTITITVLPADTKPPAQR